jgi:hypothetical protein
MTGLVSICHEKTTKMPIVSLSRAKRIQVVTAVGKSNAAQGITEVKRSTLSTGT